MDAFGIFGFMLALSAMATAGSAMVKLQTLESQVQELQQQLSKVKGA